MILKPSYNHLNSPLIKDISLGIVEISEARVLKVVEIVEVEMWSTNADFDEKTVGKFTRIYIYIYIVIYCALVQ